MVTRKAYRQIYALGCVLKGSIVQWLPFRNSHTLASSNRLITVPLVQFDLSQQIKAITALTIMDLLVVAMAEKSNAWKVNIAWMECDICVLRDDTALQSVNIDLPAPACAYQVGTVKAAVFAAARMCVETYRFIVQKDRELQSKFP